MKYIKVKNKFEQIKPNIIERILTFLLPLARVCDACLSRYGKPSIKRKVSHASQTRAREENGLHYHRRGPGGIGRHRPWQVKAGDQGDFWKRF